MENISLRWADEDHVWINGKQFVSLVRAGEMIRERTEKKTIKETSDRYTIERYSLTLRHEMLAGYDSFEIEPPFSVEYCAPANAMISGPIAINVMLDKMQYEILHKHEQEAAP